MISFGKGVFADLIKDLKIRSSKIRALNPTSVLIREVKRRTQREDIMKMEAKIGIDVSTR